MENKITQDQENEIRTLYQKLLQSWNSNNAGEFAKLFADDGNVIGFDGSQMNGRKQIQDELTSIFANHKVASFIGVVREIRAVAPTVFILRAVAGMVPQHKKKINPEVNTIQTLIAQKENNGLLVSLYQNTPAAFHGRPELSKQLTDELQEVVNAGLTIR